MCVCVSKENYLSVSQLLKGNRPQDKKATRKKKHKGLQIIGSWNKFDCAHRGIYLDYCTNTKSDVWSGARKKTLLNKGAAQLGNAQPFKKVHSHHHQRLLSLPTSDAGHMWLTAFIDEEQRASWLGR